MAINLICPECKSNLSLRARICKNCGYHFLAMVKNTESLWRIKTGGVFQRYLTR